MKLSVLLGRADALAGQFKGCITDFIKFFKASQGAFQGEKRTYVPKEGMIDEPNERKHKGVVTTVSEKLQWLKSNHSEYLTLLFQQEATNASGQARTELVVENESWGAMSSLELMRLKGLLEGADLKTLYAEIPVRSDAEQWSASAAEEYKDRTIFEGPLFTGVKKTTTKVQRILDDPNIQYLKDSSGYKPTVSSVDTVQELGDYTHQKYSGEYSQRQRAGILRRIGVLHAAVCEALKRCNDVEVITSHMTGDKLFDYLHTDK